MTRRPSSVDRWKKARGRRTRRGRCGSSARLATRWYGTTTTTKAPGRSSALGAGGARRCGCGARPTASASRRWSGPARGGPAPGGWRCSRQWTGLVQPSAAARARRRAWHSGKRRGATGQGSLGASCRHGAAVLSDRGALARGGLAAVLQRPQRGDGAGQRGCGGGGLGLAIDGRGEMAQQRGASERGTKVETRAASLSYGVRR